jgi:hypothetical protein
MCHQATRSEATLAKSFSQLQVKKFDLEFTVDPLFKKTCADFDEGGAMGLLMNHLGVDGKGRVVFDAGDVEDEEEDEEEKEEDEEDEEDLDMEKMEGGSCLRGSLCRSLYPTLTFGPCSVPTKSPRRGIAQCIRHPVGLQVLI